MRFLKGELASPHALFSALLLDWVYIWCERLHSMRVGTLKCLFFGKNMKHGGIFGLLVKVLSTSGLINQMRWCDGPVCSPAVVPLLSFQLRALQVSQLNINSSLCCASPPVHFWAAAYYSRIHFITTFNFKAVGRNHVGANKPKFWTMTGTQTVVWWFRTSFMSGLPQEKYLAKKLFGVRTQPVNSCCCGSQMSKCGTAISVLGKNRNRQKY